ncbi:MAG TPA: hypothetical protein VHL09_10200 [Dehalococcoidia bacterium]|nr:hypothetical protein [Dehalococcoidia bacterium]
MVTILIRTESIDLLGRWERWVERAGYRPVLTTSLAAAHAYLFRAGRWGELPAVIVTTMPLTEARRATPRWDWLDALRASAAPSCLLLLARHEALLHSPRPGSVLLADPDLTEAEFRACLDRLIDRPAGPRRPGD